MLAAVEYAHLADSRRAFRCVRTSTLSLPQRRNQERPDSQVCLLCVFGVVCHDACGMTATKGSSTTRVFQIHALNRRLPEAAKDGVKFLCNPGSLPPVVVTQRK